MRLFKTKAVPDDDGFFDTVPADAVLPNQMATVTINGQKLILTRWKDKVYAFEAACPHAAADMSDGGWVNKWKVVCPDHDYCFDMRSARITWPEDENYRLKMFAVKEVGGRIRVKLN